MLKAASALPEHSPHISSRWPPPQLPPRSATPTRTPRSGTLAAISGSLSKGSLPSCDQKRCPPSLGSPQRQAPCVSDLAQCLAHGGPWPSETMSFRGRNQYPLGEGPSHCLGFSTCPAPRMGGPQDPPHCPQSPTCTLKYGLASSFPSPPAQNDRW